ncbi:putative 17-beta-estradiol 17-dehydrogenase [Dioscorea sansibarensis]
MISDMATKKVVLITGCAKGGIGYEYCKAFAGLGCQVIGTDIPNQLDELSDLELDGIQVLPLDVLSDDSVTTTVAKIISEFGRVDVLINNAGIGCIGPMSELPLEEVRRTWEVNSLGQLRLVQAVAPHMIRSKFGRIANVGSIVGLVPTPWAGPYCASKAWAHATSDVLRMELRPFGVHVIKVMPGMVRSNFGQSSLDRLGSKDWKIYKGFKEVIEERAKASQGGRAAKAAEVAKVVASKVLRPRPPREIIVGGFTGFLGLLAWLPGPVQDLYFTNRFGLNKNIS